jgi:hypothetical protein
MPHSSTMRGASKAKAPVPTVIGGRALDDLVVDAQHLEPGLVSKRRVHAVEPS